MTFEATITKLIWILSNSEAEISKEEIQELYYRKINYDILMTG